MSSAEIRAFGREVRRQRDALRMSLETLGEACGLSPNYIGDVETGKRHPRGASLAVAFRIAKGPGVALPDLHGGHEGLGPMGIEAGRVIEAMPLRIGLATMAMLRAIGSARGEKGARK